MKVLKIHAFGSTGQRFVRNLAARYDTTVTEIPPKSFQLTSRYEVAVPWRDEFHYLDLRAEAMQVVLSAWGSGYKMWIEGEDSE